MSWGSGFKTVTATFKRGGAGDKTTLGTLRGHFQELSAAFINASGGVYPMNALSFFVKGNLYAFRPEQNDIMEVTETIAGETVTTKYTIFDVKNRRTARVKFVVFIVEGYAGKVSA